MNLVPFNKTELKKLYTQRYNFVVKLNVETDILQENLDKGFIILYPFKNELEAYSFQFKNAKAIDDGIFNLEDLDELAHGLYGLEAFLHSKVVLS